MSFKKFYNVIYDDKGRRHWKIEKPSTEPVKKKKAPPIDYSKALEARDFDVEVLKTIGDRRKIKAGDDPGFTCKLCNIILKDSLSWVDHLNSATHNRMLGTQMKVEKVTVDAIDEKLKSLKKRKKKK